MPTEPTWVQQVGELYLVPILHGRVEFCRPLRQAIRELHPDHIALELPQGLESLFGQAVQRFPLLSLITAASFSEEGDNDQGAPMWRIEPTDPFCEALRTALELGIPFSFVDDFQSGYPTGVDRLPDPYLVTGLGAQRYYETCLKLWNSPNPDPRQAIDAKREEAMAYRLQRLKSKGRIVFVGGMKHVDPMLKLLERPLEIAENPARPLPALKIYHPSLRTVRTLADEIPFVTTLYELQRGGPGQESAWASPLVESPGAETKVAPEDPTLDRKSVFGALEKLLGMKVASEEQSLSPDQMKRLNAYLKSLNPESWTPPSFDDADSPPEEAPNETPEGEGRFFTFKDTNQRRAEMLEEYQRLNGICRTAEGCIDRQLVYRELLKLAGRFYNENTGETFKDWQFTNLNTFSRRYAVLQGKLIPGLLPMIYSARACVDHNFAYEFWDLATFYPWQQDTAPDASTFDFDGKELEIDGLRLRHFQFQRTFPRLRQSVSRMPLPERQSPTDDPNDWSGAFESGRICSYPPEDIVIEDYGRYLQKKAIRVQSEAHSRTEPFTTSLLDGIDMRTTLRNWADGQKLYVREEKKIQGGTGSVVMVFDDDAGTNTYPWCITWHGEHDQESDMAFYATDRRKKVVGPGIARCEYGGLLLSYPPRRLSNVWNDPHYRGAKTKAEVLLFAAIDYCLDKHILYVASEAPRSYFFSLAQRFGKKLVYLPIGTLSPTSLERIRVFHVLAGHRYREIAGNFIW